MDGWQITAAIATSVSALVIAWQAFETRRSAAASNDAVGVAKDSLKVAREETARSTALVAESVKARLDAGAPTLTFAQVPRDGEEYSVAEGSPRGAAADLKRFRGTFHVPQDNYRSVWIKVPIRIENEGASSVTLSCYPPVFDSEFRGDYPEVSQSKITIAPRAGVTCGVLLGGSLSQWVASSQGASDERQRLWAQFAVELKGNSGVVLIQRIEVLGTPAEEYAPGEWRLNRIAEQQRTTEPTVSLPPHQKTYVLDRSNELVLSDAPAGLFADSESG